MSKKAKREEHFQQVLANKKIIFKICRSYCEHPEDREDLAQEIIIQLWQSGDRYDASMKFSTWMYRISLNVAISYHRKQSTRLRRLPDAGDVLLELPDDRKDKTFESDDVRLLYQFIHQLDVLNKALMLLYLEDFSYQDIAEILGISKTNVATKISRIKMRLKQDFKTLQQQERGVSYEP